MKAFLLWWRAERGVSTITLFILSLPMIIGSFGFGFDEVRAVHLRGYLANRATLAVQVALAGATNTNSDGNLQIDPVAVQGEVNQLYLENTDHYRSSSVLSCPTSELESNPIVAGQCGGEFKVMGQAESLATYCTNLSSGGNLNYGIDFRVKEQINTVFLRIIGISTLTLPTIEAKAYLRPTCP